MKTPKPRRERIGAISDPPPGADLRVTASQAPHIGCLEHKERPSFAGGIPGHASTRVFAIPPFADSQAEIAEWLRQGIRSGYVGAPWEGCFPRYVLHKQGGIIYEARLVNRGAGEYKGYYPLDPTEWPEGFQYRMANSDESF